jgi:two-component system response regulator AlgR
MRVLIVDDEALARLRLRALLESLRDTEAALQGMQLAEAVDASDAMAQLKAAAPDAGFDLLLLDIRMPGASPNMGLRLAAALRAQPQPPAVVFVSAHAEHALTAFELEAVDYLTKPVRRERLLAALQRVIQRQEGRSASAWGTSVWASTGSAALEAPALVVSERGRVLRLPLPEVLYLKAGQKNVLLRTVAHSYVLDDALHDLEQRLAQLGGPPFIRVHRNALVARHAVRALALRDVPGDDDGAEGWAVRVAPLDEWLAVSRRQVAAVRAALAESGPS